MQAEEARQGPINTVSIHLMVKDGEAECTAIQKGSHRQQYPWCHHGISVDHKALPKGLHTLLSHVTKYASGY